MLQILIHQHTNRHSQRLRSHITCHAQNQGLEAYNHRNLRYHRFKQTNNRRYTDTESQQDNQPRQSLTHTVKQRFIQILALGQTSQHGVVFTHLIIHSLDDILSGNNTQNTIILIQNGDGILRIIPDLIQGFGYLVRSVYIGVRVTDQFLKIDVIPRHDQILQIQCTVEGTVFIAHIHRIDIVVILGLSNHFLHGLPDGKSLFNHDEVRRHLAT